MKEVRKERLSNFELMRIVSMFMIIIWHLITRSNILEHCSETIYLFLKFFQYFTIVHVNSFILVTGYFGYKNKFKLGKIVSLLSQSLFYRVLFVVVFLSLGLVTLSRIDIFKNIFPVDITSYWYLNCYIVLLCIQPFLNKLIKVLSQKEHRNLIFVMIFLFSLVPNFSYQINIRNDGFTIVQFIMLYFVGAYFAKYPLNENLHFRKYSKYKKQLILISTFVFSLCFNFLAYNFCNYLISFDSDIIREIGYFFRQGCELYSGIFVIIQSLSYFLFFETLSLKNRFINHIASLTFGVYLIHENILVRNQLYKFLKLDVNYVMTSNIIILRILLYAVAIFVICILIEQLRVLLIKFVNKGKIVIKLKNKIHKIMVEF